MVLSVLKSAEAPGSKLHEKPLGYPADLRDIPEAGYPGRNQDILLLGYPVLNQDIPIKAGYPTLGRDIPKLTKVGYPNRSINPTRDISLLGYRILLPTEIYQKRDISVRTGISRSKVGYPGSNRDIPQSPISRRPTSHSTPPRSSHTPTRRLRLTSRSEALVSRSRKPARRALT